MKQAVLSISCYLWLWHVNRARTEWGSLSWQTLCYSICYISAGSKIGSRCFSQKVSPEKSNDWTLLYCIEIIKSCYIASVMPRLNCVCKAMTVIRESISQNEWDEKQCWQEFTRKDLVHLRGAGVVWWERC